MTTSIYKNRLPEMQAAARSMQETIAAIRKDLEKQSGMDPIEHILFRIKSEESMREKCRRKGLPENEESALCVIRDAIGFRVVCPFLDDVYAIAAALRSAGYEVTEEKDYIRSAKPNGYRSYHMILREPGGLYLEIQLRTISMDTWAALEHHMKYKKKIGADAALIGSELKRCADELASTDVSMQEIRNLIFASARAEEEEAVTG